MASRGDELRFQGTVLWSSSVLAGVRFCLKTELLLFPGVMSNTQERAGVWCGAHDTGHCFSHYPSCQSFGGLCFKKFNKAFSSEVWIKLIFSEGLVRHRLTHTYCGFAQFHTHRNNYTGGNSQARWFAQRHSRQCTQSRQTPESLLWSTTLVLSPPCIKALGLLSLDKPDCPRCTFNSIIAKLVSGYENGFIN